MSTDSEEIEGSLPMDVPDDKRKENPESDVERMGDEEESSPGPRCKQYLIDRSNGHSLTPKKKRQEGGSGDGDDIIDNFHYDDSDIIYVQESKPPCFACLVPKPVVWFSCLIEQNCIFETLGRVGLFSSKNQTARRICIGTGLFLNIIGLLTSTVSLFAISYHYGMIQWSFFNRFSITTADGEMIARIGMRALTLSIKPSVSCVNGGSGECTHSQQEGDTSTLCIAWNCEAYPELTAYGRTVIEAEDYCDIDSVLLDPQSCDQCSTVSSRVVFTLCVSLVMCIPSITTSFLRLYENYDCNCQKVFASFAAVISCAFAVWTCLLYYHNCLQIFSDGSYCYNFDGDIIEAPPSGNCHSVEPEGSWRLTSFTYIYGPGWYCLITACICKILDMLLNFIIPTPTICRDRKEQEEYEKWRQAHDNDSENLE